MKSQNITRPWLTKTKSNQIFWKGEYSNRKFHASRKLKFLQKTNWFTVILWIFYFYDQIVLQQENRIHLQASKFKTRVLFVWNLTPLLVIISVNSCIFCVFKKNIFWCAFWKFHFSSCFVICNHKEQDKFFFESYIRERCQVTTGSTTHGTHMRNTH